MKPQCQVYEDWLAEQSPQNYEVAFGGGDGDYSGFKICSDLQDAISGQAEMMRDDDRYRFALMYDMSNRYLDHIESDYRKANEQAYEGEFGGTYEFFPRMPKPQHLVDYQDDLGARGRPVDLV